MAARATRSASRSSAAASGGDDSRCLLLALSHDELGVIVDGLADPLQPVVAVALSSTCKGLRTPVVVKEARLILMQRHARAVALCRKMQTSCMDIIDAVQLDWDDLPVELNAADLATLGMILRTNGLLWLKRLYFDHNDIGDAGVQALCEGLGRSSAPSLNTLSLTANKIGPAGAEALAGALCKGALPQLRSLYIDQNPIGSRGITALAAPLRKLSSIKCLILGGCDIGDEGVASLVANLGKDDFKALEKLFLDGNELTDASCAALARARDAPNTTALPRLATLALRANPATSEMARKAAWDALHLKDPYGVTFDLD